MRRHMIYDILILALVASGWLHSKLRMDELETRVERSEAFRKRAIEAECMFLPTADPRVIRVVNLGRPIGP